ncbi:hypothetical protein [Macrococcoides caseolyticum]|uniref:hypothetical protein n=1 Tax=Macrococcoides caseolyticum TaxID=69966 RepID=UPI0024BD2A90|nr:hypothetical protein [Macrococcus caseolyticus]MDJ1088042.1 hypothetical protein [Macrococcus caseolyticus]
MKSRRHRAIYWAYTGQKKKHRVARSTDELEARFNIAKAMKYMVSKAMKTLSESASKWGAAISKNRHLKRS